MISLDRCSEGWSCFIDTLRLKHAYIPLVYAQPDNLSTNVIIVLTSLYHAKYIGFACE